MSGCSFTLSIYAHLGNPPVLPAAREVLITVCRVQWGSPATCSHVCLQTLTSRARVRVETSEGWSYPVLADSAGLSSRSLAKGLLDDICRAKRAATEGSASDGASLFHVTNKVSKYALPDADLHHVAQSQRKNGGVARVMRMGELTSNSCLPKMPKKSASRAQAAE